MGQATYLIGFKSRHGQTTGAFCISRCGAGIGVDLAGGAGTRRGFAEKESGH